MEYKQTRGHRNNNPLNIRLTKDKWKGMSEKQTDGSFVQFDSRVYGFRAAFKIVQNYLKRGKSTLREIIYTWAPPNENNSENYLRFCSGYLGIPQDAKISPLRDIIPLVRAMAYMETGNWYPDFEIYEAYEMLDS